MWWNWSHWEREIDWMALHGVNLPLSFIGQEYVWREVYNELGLNDNDLDEFFSGPAFLPWQRMGNLDGWQGPLSVSWMNKSRALQLEILKRQREFGMKPVLPAFSGHIPRAVTRLFPNANVSHLSSWNDFPGTYFLSNF